jgi:hypothetical protein
MPNYMKNGGDAKASKPAKKTSAAKMRKATPMLEVIVDESVPTEKEQKMLEQMKKEMDMDRGTDRGATRPKRLDYAEPFKDGGMVSKGRGNGIAIRGIRKCKMS